MRRLLEEILAGALLTAIAIGLGLGWYSSHQKVAEITRERDQAVADVTATKNAYKTQAAGQAVAKTTQDAATARLATAVAASPSVASEVVPDAIWQAIYGEEKNDACK
ncbi:hypothetical protein [Robbsia andropogonis]|uniref:hypothetical protein n=1 Tax=Robbsia andropogonis TaxID=28092 RepID=UPI002A6A5638|nr:hypothetical protein [Robbsia andropogonis]